MNVSPIEILQIFAEAQRMGARSLARMREEYGRIIVTAPPPVRFERASTGQCAACGAMLEYRVGCYQPVHVGAGRAGLGNAVPCPRGAP